MTLKVDVKQEFLSEQSFKNLSSIVTDLKFPWFKEYIIDPKDFDKFDFLCDSKLNHQFTHRLYDNQQVLSEFCKPIMRLFKHELDIHRLVTAKLNYNPVWSDVVEHIYHVDTALKCKTAVFYLNTNDGYTAFESGDKVYSNANQIVIFDSSVKHTGTTCTNAHGRYVLNINYFTSHCTGVIL